MLRPLRAAAVLLSLSLFVRGAPSPGQSVASVTAAVPADVELARVAFTRGVMLAQQDRWSQALEEFRQSRRYADRPRTAFNVGLALQHLERFREARAALRECIAMPAVVTEADLVTDAHALEAQVTRSLARLRLVVAPPGAEVRVNSQAIADGRGEPVRELDIDPGRQEVEVSAAGVTTQRFTVALRPGESLQRRVDLAVVPGRVAVLIDQPDAVVSIDDEVVGHGNTLWQGSPGAHRVRVEAEGFRPYRRPVTVSALGQAGDFNGNGAGDVFVITARSGVSNGGNFLLGRSFSRATETVVNVSQRSLDFGRGARLGDIDGDGLEDFGVATGFPGGIGESGAVYLVMGTTETSVRTPEVVPSTVGAATTVPALLAPVMDTNRDGLGEFAVGLQRNATVRVYRGAAVARSGGFVEVAPAVAGAEPEMSLSTAGDFNGDGRGDFVVG